MLKNSLTYIDTRITVTESQSIQSWKEPTGITESNSWLHTAPPKIKPCDWEHWQNSPWALALGAVTPKSLLCAQSASAEDPFPDPAAMSPQPPLLWAEQTSRSLYTLLSRPFSTFIAGPSLDANSFMSFSLCCQNYTQWSRWEESHNMLSFNIYIFTFWYIYFKWNIRNLHCKHFNSNISFCFVSKFLLKEKNIYSVLLTPPDTSIANLQS